MNGVEAAEQKIGQVRATPSIRPLTYKTGVSNSFSLQIIELITGHAEPAKQRSEAYVEKKSDQTRQKGAEYESAGKKYWNEKVDEAKKKAEEAKVEL